MKVDLTRSDWSLAAAIAFDRAERKQQHQDRLQTRRTGILHADTIGALGEIKFAQLTGLPVDTAVYAKGDKYDFLAGDCRVAVKTREWSGKDLEMHLFPDEPKRADVFVLFRIGDQCDWIQLVGHVDSDLILEHHKPQFHEHLYGRKICVPAFVFNRPQATLDFIKQEVAKKPRTKLPF